MWFANNFLASLTISLVSTLELSNATNSCSLATINQFLPWINGVVTPSTQALFNTNTHSE